MTTTTNTISAQRAANIAAGVNLIGTNAKAQQLHIPTNRPSEEQHAEYAGLDVTSAIRKRFAQQLYLREGKLGDRMNDLNFRSSITYFVMQLKHLAPNETSDGASIGAVSGAYNNVKKEFEKAGHELVQKLGRPPEKNNGGPKRKVDVAATAPGALDPLALLHTKATDVQTETTAEAVQETGTEVAIADEKATAKRSGKNGK